VLVEHLLPLAGQRHSEHKNECEGLVTFIAQYVVTNIIVEVVKCNCDVSMLDIPRHYCQYFDQCNKCLQEFWLCMKYISRTH
jgi:hypothetical protein